MGPNLQTLGSVWSSLEDFFLLIAVFLWSRLGKKKKCPLCDTSAEFGRNIAKELVFQKTPVDMAQN